MKEKKVGTRFTRCWVVDRPTGYRTTFGMNFRLPARPKFWMQDKYAYDYPPSGTPRFYFG
jgi:hypothetical protein